MTFNKPVDVTYVQMAIIFDKEFYTKDRNDEKLYSYMYHLIYMLACKKHYFTKWVDYDEFAVFAANILYMRFKNRFEKNGFIYKSVLNYIKKTLFPLKIMYQNEAYKEIINPQINNEAVKGVKAALYESVQADYNKDIDDVVTLDLQDITNIIKEQVYTLPFKNDKILCYNLYMSSLLTFLSNITIDNELLAKLERTKQHKIIAKLASYKNEPCILWHLDESYDGFVKLILNKSRADMTKRINATKQQFTLPDDVIENILTTAYSTYGIDQSDD